MKNKVQEFKTKNTLKGIFLIMFLIVSTTKLFSQEVKTEIVPEKKKYIEYIYVSDVLKSKDTIYSIDKTVKMLNGKKKEVDVKFTVSFFKYEPTESDLGKININLEYLIWLTELNLKNKYSFEPFEVKVYKKPTFWTIYLKYTAKNDYGAEKDGLKVFKYDLTGKQIKE
jgi:hypothetical protein